MKTSSTGEICLFSQSDFFPQVGLRAGRVLAYEIHLATHGFDCLFGLKGLLGYEPGEVEAGLQWWLDRVHPEDREKFEAGVRAAAAGTARSHETEYRLRCKDGLYVLVRETMAVIRDLAATPVRIVCCVQELSRHAPTTRRLPHNEPLLDTALGACGVGVWVWDVAGGTLSVNDDYQAIYGLVPGESLTYANWQARLHPEDVDRLEHSLRRCLLDGTEWHEEFRIVHPERGPRWLIGVGRVVRDPQDRPCGMTGVTLDITEWPHGGRTLRQVEQRYRTIIEAAPIGIGFCDRQGRILDVNHAFFRITGCSPNEDAAGQVTWQELLASECIPHDCGALQRAATMVPGVPREAELIRKDGSRVAIQLSLTSLEGQGGDQVAFVVDLTGQRLVAEQLRQLNSQLEQLVDERTQAVLEREARIRAILDTPVDAIITINHTGIIESINPATERMFGYSASELVGSNVSMLMPLPFREEHDGYIARYRKTGVRHVIGTPRETVAQRKDGVTFPVEVAINEIPALKLFTGIVRDNTRRKELEREVLEIAALEQRAIGQELHDSVGQELTGLGLIADALAQRLVKTAPAEAELATRLAAGIQRTHQQVRALSHGLVPVEVDPGGLRAALEEMAARTREQAGILCSFQGCDAVKVLDSATATHLFRIAQEAVNNALRHGRAKSIIITLRGDSRFLTLSIQDDGLGIAQLTGLIGGVGLRLMQNRAGVIGATLSIGPAPEAGTLVTCVLPWRSRSEQEVANESKQESPDLHR